MNYEERFIVQDLETFEFLCSDQEGGFEMTPYLSLAGRFESYDDAFESAIDEIGGSFSIFKFFELQELK